MGNSSSQSLHQHVLETQRQAVGAAGAAGGAAHQKWAHSYPRDAQRRIAAPQNKVLPERIPGQRLRVTDNGAILHNGGTISGRRQSPGRYSDEEQPGERYRSRSISAHRHPPPPQRHPDNLKANGKRFGSEPDLRHPAPHKESPSKQRITRTRKKYKAPPAPHLEGESHGPDTSSPDSSQWEHLDPPARRLRLFKTREEQKKDLAPRGAPPRGSSPESQRPLQAKERNGRDRERNIPRGRSQEKIVLNVREHDRNIHGGREQERNNRDRERNSSKGRDQERYTQHGREQENNSRGERSGREQENNSRGERSGRERERSMPNGRENERYISKGRDQERNGLEDSKNDRSRKLERIIPNGREQARNVSKNREPEKNNMEPVKGREQERSERNISSNRDKLDRIVLNVRNHERNVPKGRMSGKPDNIRIMPDHGIRMKVEKSLMESPTIPRVNGFRHVPPMPTAKLLQRNLSTPEFQAELISAAQRLRRTTPQPQRDEKPEWERQPRRGERRGVPVGEAAELRPRGDGSGRESTPEPLPERKKNEARREIQQEARKPKESHWDILPPIVPQPSDRDVPTKTFYFGMEQGERDAVERFAASIHRVPANPPPASGSGGSLSSDLADDDDDDELDGGIALQLRPMLPKKQLEIPRFSPTAAWRLLSAVEAPGGAAQGGCGSGGGDEPPVLLEERIQRMSRPMAPPQMVQAARSSHDKSGDSGISGDASPGGCHEDSSEAPLASPPIRKPLSPTLHTAQRALVTAWTPQQDLGEEESSSDGGVDDSPIPTAHGAQPKFSPRAQVFSLSLPRDERLCLALYSESSKGKRDVQPSFNSLKKLKRSVSGAFTALNTPTKVKEDAHLLDENWLLSRSVSNSLNGGHPHGKPLSSTGSPSSPEHDPSSRTSFSYLASGGHVMYLPACKTRHEPDRSYGTLRVNGVLSKSCENISSSEMRQLDRTPSPDLDSSGRLKGYPELDRDVRQDETAGKRGKNRRFTFQSTVRQIERRRISERLSREAETKERRRLGELEAMRRVEEEFQRKRAPEKANIRHQLRLFNLDEQLFSSLPNGWTDSAARAEPDGATSSSPSPNADSSPDQASGVRPPTTQILSEFREPRRDYREYRPNSARYTEISPDSLPEKRSTVHPSVVYDMPKSAHVYVASPRQAIGGSSLDVDRGGMSTPRSSSSDNYRRDFAHGALRSLASSDSELSQPNTRPTSRQRSRSPSPMPGRRCKSAEPRSGSEEEEEQPIAPGDQQTPAATSARLNLTSVQPFVLNGKGYRPIAFNLGTSPSHNVAQPVN